MNVHNMPEAEVDVDADLVRRLLREQHPDLAPLPCAEVAFGWDNVIFRLGDELCVRLPRRQIVADMIVNEQRWLPQLAPRLPLPTPAAIRLGRPGCGYPWTWSVCRWIPGEIAADAPPADPMAAARSLGAFLAALHAPAPPDAPTSAFRGSPLESRSAGIEQNLAQLGEMVDAAAIRTRWERLVDTPPREGAPVWVHGDLHPANVLVHDGALSGVIDFVDLTSGDSATDLAIAWMLFEPDARAEFRQAAGTVDDDTWARARGWALAFAVLYIAMSADHATIARIGRVTLAAVLAEP